MPSVFTRLYANEKTGADVRDALKKAGYADADIDVFSAAKSEDGDYVVGAGGAGGDLAERIVAAGVYPTAAKIYAAKVGQGNALVVLRATFGRGVRALQAFHKHNPIETDVKYTEVYQPPEQPVRNIIRVSGKKSVVQRRSDPAQRKLTKSPTPFSSALGMKTVIQRRMRDRPASNGPRLITKGLGMPMLTGAKLTPDRLKSDDPTPLSSMLFMPTVIRRRRSPLLES
ncbi:MAG: hypothetical protein ACFB00_06290 [Parvularculaceae bacterium]